MTYEEVFKHLTATGKAQHIEGEDSATFAPDGYLPRSWKVLPELDVIPASIEKQARFLYDAITTIQAKARAAELDVAWLVAIEQRCDIISAFS